MLREVFPSVFIEFHDKLNANFANIKTYNAVQVAFHGKADIPLWNKNNN